MRKPDKLNWGILSTGKITHQLAEAINESDTAELFAVASRDIDTANKWNGHYNVPHVHGSYESMLADPDVDVIYNATPNHLHAKWTILAAEAGKHVLCEKPLASHVGEVMAMLDACRRNKVCMIEAFMWRCHPMAKQLHERVKDGTIGDVGLIESSYAFNWGPWQADNCRAKSEQSGGGIMDVGTYAVCGARLVAGAALGKDFADPIDVDGSGHINAQGRVDEWAAATMRFDNDIVANVSCGLSVNTNAMIRIWGSTGSIEVLNPWNAAGPFTVRLGDDAPREETIDAKHCTLYVYEVDMMARCVADGRLEAYSPAMTWADSIGQQHAIDRWRRGVGVIFDVESEQGLQQTITGRPVVHRSDHRMTYGRIEGVDKNVSRVVLGSTAICQTHPAEAFATYDHFFESGGSAFDTAWWYGTEMERVLGQWVNARGVRKQVVLTGKIAHVKSTDHPYDEPGCEPESATRELHESLEHLGTDYLDIVLLHRDNPSVPVGEWVDVFNEHLGAGLIHTWGGSNWTIDRIDEVNAYARKHNKRGIAAISNQFSLMKWNEPTWALCESCRDENWRQWLTSSRIPNLAWSSQSAGLLAGRRDDQMTRVWDNPANTGRIQRADALAKKRGCTANNIALAFVLRQPFESYAVIGPENIEQVRTSLDALDVMLTPDELQQLDVGDSAS